nr:hypothetical protein B0A51_15677 [Rachicladosporium sp. CCFEE 5018]
MSRRKGAIAGPKESLWTLMNTTQGLDCAQPKDRIFALLGVADPILASSIVADYRTPLRSLLNAVLQTRHIETKPLSIEAAAIECGQLTDMFELDSSSIYKLENEDGIIALPKVDNLSKCPLGDSSPRAIMLWWTTWYNHDAVQWLLLGTDKSPTELLLEAWEWAVENNELPTMRHISMTGRIDIAGYNNALKVVSAAGRGDCVKLLLEIGADMNAQDKFYGNFLQAAYRGEHQRVADMLVDVNAESEYYDDALRAACAKGHEKVAEILIRKGADVNARGGLYGNALQTACAYGRENMAKMLIRKGVGVNAQGSFHGNALQVACVRGHERVAEMLIANGADVNAQGGYYGNALQASLSRGYEKLAEMLMQNGADVNAQDEQHGNALEDACIAGDEKMVEILIRKKADVNAQGQYYNNALQAACGYDRAEIIILLLRNGADINAKGGRYGSASGAAHTVYHKKMVKLLIQAGLERQCLEGERAGSERGEASI